MNDDSVDHSSQPQLPVVEPVEQEAPHTNYSRWMTDMASEIGGLTLHQLAIPGAHNSGVDMQGTWGLEELLGACQNDTFYPQFEAGARFLDLRLEDKSYWKLVGNFAPERVYIEALEFTHGQEGSIFNVSAGRSVKDLVTSAVVFAVMNPGEIIILNIRHFKGLKADSANRLFAHLTALKQFLIPVEAYSFTIDLIRSNYSGRNIILCYDHAYPDNWKPEWVQRDQLWRPIYYVWSTDLSEKAVTEQVEAAVLSPPHHVFWALSAAARNANGPMHLKANHPIRTEVFRNGRQTANIVMVDFIERAETIASVTDLCIALNRARVHNVKPPTRPENLFVSQVPEDGLQNTLEFSWNRADDGLGVRTYQVFGDDKLLFTSSEIPHREKNFPLKNYTFKVRAVNVNGLTSEFSLPFTLIQDVTRPTIPGNFRFTKAGPTTVELAWNPSFDQAGIEYYEVVLDGAITTTTNLSHSYHGLLQNKPYVFYVRAKDINGLFSEYAEVALQPRPEKLENPIIKIDNIMPGLPIYHVNITWDPLEHPEGIVKYNMRANDFGSSQWHVDGVSPTCNLLLIHGVTVKLESEIFFSSLEKTESGTFEFTLDLVPPLPVRNLKIQSRTLASTIITWSGSFSANTVKYAISLNEQTPIYVEKTTTHYEFQELPAHEEFLIEVWAINELAIPSEVRSATVEPIPGYISPPTNFRFTQAFLPTLEWDPPSLPVTDYRVILTGPGGNELGYTVVEPKLETPLLPRTRYDVKIMSHNDMGWSLPLVSAFTTK